MTLTTTCTLDCPDMCSIHCTVDGDDIHLSGDPDHPITRGLLCRKIRRYPERLRAEGRITRPQVRDDDGFHTVEWDEALDVVCGAVARAAAADPARVLLVRSAGSMGWSKELVDYVFGCLGARVARGSLCSAVVDQALAVDTGATRQNDPREIARAAAVVLWGKNPMASSIHTAAFVADAHRGGAPVMAVTPDPAGVASLADMTIRLRPGSDRFLALAVTKLLLDRVGRPVPWDQAADPQAFRDLLERHALDDLLEACDVPPEDARRLADLYASTPRVATVLGWGLGRYDHGGENARAVHALAFLADTLRRPGAGLFGGTDPSRLMQAPRPPLPGDGAAGGPATARPLVVDNPAQAGPRAADNPAQARPRAADNPLLPRLGTAAAEPTTSLDVVWITCSNIVAQAPDGNAIRRTLAAVPTVVVVDGFWTDTALCADVVLPSTLWLEEEDVVSSYGHAGIGFVRKVAEPPAGCRTDVAIVTELARRLDLDLPFGSLDDWLAACLPGGRPQLQRLRRRSWMLSDEPAVVWQDGFAHPDGRFRLLDRVTPDRPPDHDYPLQLLSLVRADVLNSQRCGPADEGPLPVRLNPDTAARLGLAEGRPIRVESAVGSVDGVLRLDPLLHPDAAVCPRGGWRAHGGAVNDVTAPRLTDIGDTAAFYSTRVRVVPA